MAEKEPLEGAAEIRAVMAKAKEPQSVSEIFAACDSLANTTAIASMLYTEVSNGRAERIGERGAYKYKLTAEGLAAAADPRLLRSRFQRRTRGRGARPKTDLAAIVKKAKPAREAKAKRTPRKAANRAATKAADKPRRGRPPGSKNPARAVAARAAPVPVATAPVPPSDAGARLAATVIACWPAPLDQMPADIARRLGQSLPTQITGA